ncbi:MAG: TIGR02757 family protein [Deltaproteobacteria bacterium]|nr:TIGR02757 family protein [Deltaproteobacteria bacterium]
MIIMPARKYARQFEDLYTALNRREFVHPDPLEFLYDYPNPADREIVALIASGLAYGGVKQILRSVSRVLERMPSPRAFLVNASRESLVKTFPDFKHRFTTGFEIATMLYGVKRVIERHGSLRSCFVQGMREDHPTALPALARFVKELSSVFHGRPRSLLPPPEAGSACKRLHLFLRWMVRKDDVDPGGWDDVPRSKLIVPLDLHMHRLCLQMGITYRKQANLRTALEITDAFRAISPDDPVRYDFCLTRLGIRDDMSPEGFMERCGSACRE